MTHSHPHTFTKQELIEKLVAICKQGWIRNTRPGNAGAVGNTIEDLLGIQENNLPIPNAAEWELKCRRSGSTFLTTLFHLEPSPRAVTFVPKVLLPLYGWPHQHAGATHPGTEMSFRQTIHGNAPSDRGFRIIIDHTARKVLVSFDSASVDPRHANWLQTVQERVGLGELNPQPYWGFDDLFHKAGTKLLNCFYIEAEVKTEHGDEYFRYSSIRLLEKFSLDRFLTALNTGDLLVDFDARSGHNHGTKFRLRQDRQPSLYECIREV